MNISTRNIAIGALVTAVAAPGFVVGGIALSAPGEGGKIDGCYDESNGLLSVLTDKKTSCDVDTETPISWNVQGPQGPQGPQGLPPAPPQIDPNALRSRRTTRAERRRARLPISPLRAGALRRRRGGGGQVGRATPIPVGNGGMRILTAEVGRGEIDQRTGESVIEVRSGRGPDSARSAVVRQTYEDPVFGTAGTGIVDVIFRTRVTGCTAVAGMAYYGSDVRVSGTGQTGSPNVVRVVMSSLNGHTPPFNVIVVCDPRNEPPTTVGVAQPVPPRPTVVVP